MKTVPLHSETLPAYDFSSADQVTPAVEPDFLPPELDASVQAPHTPPVAEIVQLKVTMINAVATSLLCSPDFRDPKNSARVNLKQLGEKMSDSDPEFVLKLTLYTRRNLNIRTTANFLLALAANLHNCRPFLKKYFSNSVHLPSDWIEIAEIYQTFHDKGLNFGQLPTSLRKVMVAKFPDFDTYQLGKYNKDASKKSKRKVKGQKPEKSTTKPAVLRSSSQKTRSDSSSSSSDSESSDSSVVSDEKSETEEELIRLTFTLKQLVRKLHIAEPVENVMCLIGKRYPEDTESFRRSRLPGIWDQDRAGKRMKIPTPETWETQISLKGNKAAVWEELIDHKKLPFMAMLRNLRNLIIAGISQKHHQWVLNKLRDERAVVNSQQFPFRFFSAYEVLGDLEKLGTNDGTPKPPPKPSTRRSKRPPRKPKEIPPIDPQLLKRYQNALDVSLKIATNYNVKPISGTTVILCNVGISMRHPCTSARGLGKPRTIREMCILLGLMCKYSCEQCTMILYGKTNYCEVSLEEGTILHNMKTVENLLTEKEMDVEEGMPPQDYFQTLLVDEVQIDNLVLLTNTVSEAREIQKFTEKYRQFVNSNLLFVTVDLSSRASGIANTITPEHKNDIHLAGYSDQILRFIAERGDDGQLSYVDNIDKAFGLVDLKLSGLQATDLAYASVLARERAMLVARPQRKWRTVRVFISSTFRDMHGERDLLTRFVFPELRSRCLRYNISLYEVDLRWGVTESDARSHKATEICLKEISRCHYFIGLIGQRYGWVPEDYQVPDSPEYDWVREYPSGRSITELEMYHAALCDIDKVVGKAFFFFRDPAVTSQIPEDSRKEFVSDLHEDTEKVEKLKSCIRTSGLEVYDGYPCKWMGIVDDKPMIGGLEDFGQRVLHNIWNAIQRDYPDSDNCEDPVEAATAIHNAFAESRASSFVGRRTLLKQACETISSANHGLVVVAGKPGSGKSAFMAALAQYCMENAVFASNHILTHFIGAAPGSSNIAALLTRLCLELKQRFSLPQLVPEDYPGLAKEWTEFLNEATSTSVETKIAIFIDGLDLLEDAHNGRSLDWLPENLPKGVVLVVSVIDGGSCLSVLRQRKPAPSEVAVGGMDIFDKAEMVRRKLLHHRKVLDESPFNNQMKILLTKREASNPLYLYLACEELRMFGVFEEVSSYLKKMPATVSMLLQEVLNRLEGEHGTEMVSTSLTLLCLVRNGLKEYELAGALSFFFNDGNNAGKLPPVFMARLLRSLQTFLQPTGQDNSDLLTLAHKDIEKAVRSRYMRGAMANREKKLHVCLSQFFRDQADPNNDCSFKGNDTRAFTELPYHLMASGSWKEMEEILCHLNFVVAKCRLGLAQQLLEDYTPTSHTLTAAKAREVSRFINLPTVKTFKSFISRNLHVLTAAPALALQQAINEPRDSPVAHYAQEILKENPMPVLSLVNKPDEENPCNMVLGGHGGAITAVAVSQDGRTFAVGSKNCVVKVFEVETGREVRMYLGHADMITGLCFVGDTAVCSASKDCSLSLWSLREGHRIAVMKGHSRAVRECVSTRNGKTVASVSWDMSIKIWDGNDGSLSSTLKSSGKNSHINCADFHPDGQLLAVGCWDATVKIWDTFNKKRLKVLKGHNMSVQACTYAPSGRHVVSAAINGEVKIWSVRSGTAVGTITGHSAPVNALSFTPNGQFLATASSDKLIKVWSGSLGKPAQIISGEKDKGYAHSLAFDQDTRCLSVGYHDGSVGKYNMHTGVLLSSVKPHSAAVKAVAYYDGLYMSASVDTTVKVWLSTPSSKSVSLVGHNSPLTAATWNKHGLATASEDLSIMIWPHAPKGYKKKLLSEKAGLLSVNPLTTLHAHTGTISAIAFSSMEGIMVTVSHDKSIVIWDTINYKPTKTIPVAHKDWINTCSFSDQAWEYLVTGSNDFTLKVWDIKTGNEKSVMKGHTSAITSVAFCMGCIISGAVDGSVKVWTQKGIEITTMYCHSQRINACFLSIPGKMDMNVQESWADVVEEEEEDKKGGGTGKKLKVNLEEVSVVTASDDGSVGVWKPFLPNHIATMKGHSDRVVSLASTLNNFFISGSLDCTVRVWNPQLPTEPGALVQRQSFEAHIGSVTDAAIRTDTVAGESGGHNTYAATSGKDGTFIVWCIRLSETGEDTVLEKLYQVKACDKALSSVLITANTGITIGTAKGGIEIWRWSTSEYPTLDMKRTAAQFAGDAIMATTQNITVSENSLVSKMVITPDRKYLVASSWNRQVLALSGTTKKVSDRIIQRNSVMDICASKQGPNTIIYSLTMDRTLTEWPLKKDTKRYSPATPGMIYEHSIHVKAAETNEKPWPLALCELDSSHLAISDSLGQITIWSKLSKMVILTKKIHQKAINALATINDCLVTGSDDSTVKVWKTFKDKVGELQLKQLGHFYCQSCVTSIAVRKGEKNTSPLLLVGDSLGHVVLLEWHK